MIDIETIILEDNNEYIITKRINDNNTEYLLLNNSSDPSVFCIRKIVVENKENYIEGLDSKEEFDRILNKIQE